MTVTILPGLVGPKKFLPSKTVPSAKVTFSPFFNFPKSGPLGTLYCANLSINNSPGCEDSTTLKPKLGIRWSSCSVYTRKPLSSQINPDLANSTNLIGYEILVRDTLRAVLTNSSIPLGP